MSIKLNISQLTIDFDTRYPEYVRRRCAGYVIDDDTDCMLSLRASEENIEKANRDNVGLMEAELYAMTIPLSELLPMHGRLMTHGVAVECDGKSFIFTALSGVGKSTHAFLWQKYLGADRVRVINGDKPILWFHPDGRVYACGSPWSGKEHLDQNVCVPLGGICLLKRLEGSGEAHPRIFRANREETLDFLLNQTFLPSRGEGLMKTFDLLETLFEKVPVFNLIADMSEEAVRTSSECLLGLGG